MEFFEAFADAFWAPLLGAMFGVLLVWGHTRGHKGSRVPFLNPKSFPELAFHTPLDRDRLLREASTLALRHWSSVVPGFAFAVCMATGAAAAIAVSSAPMIPNSVWVKAAICGGFGALAAIVSMRMTTRQVRPFLIECLRLTEKPA
jgi:hypothetical protein